MRITCWAETLGPREDHFDETDFFSFMHVGGYPGMIHQHPPPSTQASTVPAVAAGLAVGAAAGVAAGTISGTQL